MLCREATAFRRTQEILRTPRHHDAHSAIERRAERTYTMTHQQSAPIGTVYPAAAEPIVPTLGRASFARAAQWPRRPGQQFGHMNLKL